MSPQVLVVDDDPDILDLVTLGLQREGFRTRTARTGQSALRELKRETPDAMILDLKLPDSSGLKILENVRKNRKTVDLPVLILSGRSELADRIAGFEQGGNDYVVKPFSPKELILRTKALIRRSRYPDNFHGGSTAAFRLEQNSLSVSLDGNRVYLSVTEFKLLKALFGNQGRILLREQLLEKLWGRVLDSESRALDAHVMRLRKKLGNYADCIDTIRGVGYRFVLKSEDSKLENA